VNKEPVQPVFSQQVPALLTHHFNQLHVGSAIAVDVIMEHGYESVLGKKRLADLGFSKAQQRTPGILIPLWGVDGQQIGYQYRPDNPRVTDKGKLIKYENKPHSSIRLDVPLRCRPMLENPNIPIFFVEGVKKADALASQGACAVALNGVWGFKGKNPFGAATILADFDYIGLKNRDCFVVYDSDYATNPLVRKAQDRLVEHLTRKGNVKVVYLPANADGKKQGVDDFLAAGHTMAEVIALATEPQEEVEEKKEREILQNYFHHNNRLYLEVRKLDGDYTFAYLDDQGKVKLTAEVVISEQKIKPRPLLLIEGTTPDYLKMPDENIAYTRFLTPEELYSEIDAHFHRYFDLPDLDRQLDVYYSLFTWFYCKVNTLGYLRLLADTGKGKSRIQRIVGDVCFYPLFAGGASSFSGMARQQNKWRGTLVVDESDFQGEKESQVTKYFNLGFEKDKYYFLSDKENPRQQDVFDPYCPKILAMRSTFKDNALERRLLSISPHETTDPRIPPILLSSYSQRAQELRNKVALFVMHHWNDVDGEKMLSFDDLGIEAGLKQLAMPLSIIFQLWPGGVQSFREYLVARQKEIRKLRAQSWEGSLFNLVYSIAIGDFDIQEEFASYYEAESGQIQAVTPTMVARQMRSSGKTVTQSLQSIGFEVERKWITIDGKDAEAEKKRVIRAYVVPSKKAWDEMMSRYYYQEGEDGKDIEVPEILRSIKFVCGEVSHLSHLSQEQPGLDGCDRCDTCDGSTDTAGKKPSIDPGKVLHSIQDKERTLALPPVYPTRYCPVCGSGDYWLRDNEWICNRCHPKPR
jgi:hypothetical protein